MKRTFYLLPVLATVIVGSLTTPQFVTNAAATPNARSASQLYSKYCISCHGRNGKSQTSKGKYNHARDLTEAQWQDDVSDERIYNSIMNGRNVRGNMPAFSNKIDGQEADSLVGFVRGLRK